MGLSAELISEFVKITNDNKKGKDENTVYGTVSTVSEDYKSGTVKIDGSDEATPFTTTCKVTEGDRVRLTVRNHNAIVTGNTTDISASAAELLEALDKIAEFKEDTGLTIQSLVTFKSDLENNTGTTKIHGGKINTDTLNLTGCISFSDLSDGDTYEKKINGAASDAEDALNTVSGWAHSDDGTYIDGEMIYSDSIYADRIHLGGSLRVYRTKDSDTVGGYLGYDSGFNSTSGIGFRYWKASFDDIVEEAEEEGEEAIIHNAQVVCTDQAARLSWGRDELLAQVVASSNGDVTIRTADEAGGINLISEGGHVDITTPNNVYINSDNSSGGIIFQLDGRSVGCFTADSFRSYPTTTDATLGVSSQRWAALYASKVYNSSGELTTSDRDAKNSIESLPDKYVDMFDRLRPVRFKYNDGTSDRYHVGYIAQEVEETMIASSIDSQEFGGFAREVDEDGNTLCMLRYDEFDAIRDAKIKQLESRIDELERRLANLETKEVG